MNKIDKIASEIKAAKYPSQEDAEFLFNLKKALDTVSTSGSSLGRELMGKIGDLRMKHWEVVFGKQSPWIIDRNKVAWDNDKADKLGL